MPVAPLCARIVRKRSRLRKEKVVFTVDILKNVENLLNLTIIHLYPIDNTFVDRVEAFKFQRHLKETATLPNGLVAIWLSSQLGNRFIFGFTNHDRSSDCRVLISVNNKCASWVCNPHIFVE